MLLNKLESEIKELGIARVKVAQNYPREGKYLKLLYSLELKTTIMEAQWKDTRNYLKGIKLLLAREKSSSSHCWKRVKCPVWNGN